MRIYKSSFKMGEKKRGESSENVSTDNIVFYDLLIQQPSIFRWFFLQSPITGDLILSSPNHLCITSVQGDGRTKGWRNFREIEREKRETFISRFQNEISKR